jgi:hypothetical protein
MTGISRKQFLQVGIAAAAAHLTAAIGCGDETSETNATSANGGNGASGNAGGGANTGGTGNSGNDGGTPNSGGAAAGGMGQGGGDAGACMGAMLTAAISLQHPSPHVLQIPIADVIAGGDKTYDTTGSNHCHRVTLTAADFATLKGGGSVTVFSCNGGDHEYVISCAANPPAPVDPPQCGGASDQTGACN